MAKKLNGPSQGATFELAAHFYRSAGQTQKARAVIEDTLRQPSDHKRAIFLAAQLRYEAGHRTGKPPVDEYLEAQIAWRHIPGVSVGVVRDGDVVLKKGYGLANVERSVPATDDTVNGIGSMTKSFTATGIMMLAEQGKLGVDDAVCNIYRTHLPLGGR